MIATILFILILIVCTIIVILDSIGKIHVDDYFGLGLAMIFGCIFFLACIFSGYIPELQKEDIELEKDEIIYLLEEQPSQYSIELAQKYNRQEKNGNNYWCRFTLREEDLIDINACLLKNKKESKE